MTTVTNKALIFTGIDVSKAELVIAYDVQGKFKKVKIENTLEGIGAWLSVFGIADKHFILEHTGVYSHRLIHALADRAALFSVVNPAQSRAMAKVLLKTHKNDDQDAQTLSVLGQKLEVKAYKMPDDIQKKRKESFSALTSLQKQEQQLKNQIHAFGYRVDPNPVAVKALNDVLKTVQEAVAVLEKDIMPPPPVRSSNDNASAQDVGTAQDPLRETVDLICSIKSVGEVTARACVTLFGNFEHFDDAKAFVKFIGLSPTEYTSGDTVRGRKSINKKGCSAMRSLLFNCARSAIQHNSICKELYQRLLEKGKNGKVALTAVMHKLARLIYGVVHSKTYFDPNFAINKQFVRT